LEKSGSLANTKEEPWKLPMPEFIEELDFKHFNNNAGPTAYVPSS
jgi:hypothetical protein